jgi:quercetin dioxygenase-like cupin family protein
MRKARLHAIVLALAAALASATPGVAKDPDPDPMVALDPQALQWGAVPGLPRCAPAAILRGDPRTGPAWVLLRLASGCRVPWHWHTANESIVVISGRGSLSMKDGPPLHFAPGAYVALPSHHVHEARCTHSCLLFDAADGAFDVHYVDAKGDEISEREALRAAQGPPSREGRR